MSFDTSPLIKMTKSISTPAKVIIGAIFLIAVVLFFYGSLHKALGDAVTSPTVTENTFKYYTFFSTTTSQTIFATTTTATSTNIASWTNSSGEIDTGKFIVSGAKKIVFYFKRGDTSGQGNAGSTAYRIQTTPKTSPSESDWTYFADLVSATSTDVYSSSLIVSATSTAVVGMDLDNKGFYAVRCIAVEATDGEHSCAASAEY